jgi:RNA recognition motif-containing protein
MMIKAAPDNIFPRIARRSRSRSRSASPKISGSRRSREEGNVHQVLENDNVKRKRVFLGRTRDLDGVTRGDLELFVGNLLSPDITSDIVKDFLNLAMKESHMVPAHGPDPICSCRLSDLYGFIEFHTAEDCTKALNLNGIPFLGIPLKIGRGARYNGPIKEGSYTWQDLTGANTFTPDELIKYGILSASHPLVNGNLTDISLTPAPTTVVDQAQSPPRNQNRHERANFRPAHSNTMRSLTELFIGGLFDPQMTNGEAIREFLGGALQKMGLASSVKVNPINHIKVTGSFAFLVCSTAEDAANLLNLNGIPFLNKPLKIERPQRFDGALPGVIHYHWKELYSLWTSGELKLMTAGSPSRVLRIDNMATIEELLDNIEYLELIKETRFECSQCGVVKSVIIPRSTATLTIDPADLGKVFVEMSTFKEAVNVLLSIKGRSFSGRCVDVKFYPEDKFHTFNYSFENDGVIVTKSIGPAFREQVLTPNSIAVIESSR